MSGRTIVVGDVHGCYDELLKLLEELALGAEDRVVLVGDLVVKGEKNREVLDLLMGDARFSAVLGNHDRALRDFWNGEVVKLKGTQERCRRELEEGRERYASYLNSLPLAVDLGTHLVVHAGVRPGVPLGEQSIEDLTELRTLGGTPASRLGTPWYEVYEGEKVVLFGHWPAREPRRGPRAIGLDTGCVYGGSLTAYVVETGELVSVRALRAYDPPAQAPPEKKGKKSKTKRKKEEVRGLDCEGDALHNVRRIITERLARTFSYREAALNWDDPEGVHDMRVASRRLRSAVRDFAPYLGLAPRMEAARARLKGLADDLGEVRDADVLIEALEEYAAEAPPEVAPGIELIAGQVRARREGARERLASALAEESLTNLRREFDDALEESASPASDGGDAVAVESCAVVYDFRSVACDVVSRRWREVLERSPAVYRPFKTKKLHKLRISAKRLRYALELLSPCFGGSLAPFAKEATKLQKELGELHDRDALISRLSDLLRGKLVREVASGGEEGEVGVELSRTRGDERGAAVWLMQRVVKERTKYYRKALKRWQAWEQDEFGARLLAAAGAEADGACGGKEVGRIRLKAGD